MRLFSLGQGRPLSFKRTATRGQSRGFPDVHGQVESEEGPLNQRVS